MSTHLAVPAAPRYGGYYWDCPPEPAAQPSEQDAAAPAPFPGDKTPQHPGRRQDGGDPSAPRFALAWRAWASRGGSRTARAEPCGAASCCCLHPPTPSLQQRCPLGLLREGKSCPLFAGPGHPAGVGPREPRPGPCGGAEPEGHFFPSYSPWARLQERGDCIGGLFLGLV